MFCIIESRILSIYATVIPCYISFSSSFSTRLISKPGLKGVGITKSMSASHLLSYTASDLCPNVPETTVGMCTVYPGSFVHKIVCKSSLEGAMQLKLAPLDFSFQLL